MDVIFVDNHLLIVNKPAGLSTQQHAPQEASLAEMAKAWIKKKYQKPGAVFLEPVHRLDKPVSGLVLFARTSKALSRLQEAMRARTLRKTYFAKIEGHLPQEQGDLEHYLVHDDFYARVASKDTFEAKLSRLHYRHLRSDVVEIVLETGRYHQIRAQCSAMGCPIVGDRKYGSLHSFPNGEILLHHGRLEFSHPVTKEALLFESLCPFFSRELVQKKDP